MLFLEPRAPVLRQLSYADTDRIAPALMCLSRSAALNKLSGVRTEGWDGLSLPQPL